MVGCTYENEELNKDEGRWKRSRRSSTGTALGDGAFEKRNDKA